MTTILENLSDEVILQCFEYLEAYQLFKAFFNLNARFNRLLKDPFLCLKFNSTYVRSINATDEEMFSTMVNYLTAITFINDMHIRMFLLVFTPSDFIRLQSLTLRRVHIEKDNGSIAYYITNFNSLKNLCIQAIGNIDALTILIFYANELSELVSYECTSSECRTNPLIVSRQKTNIERLSVDCITFSLENLFLKTPKLKYLNVKLTNRRRDSLRTIYSPLPVMKNLIHLKMKMLSVSHNDLAEIIKSMPHLETLELSGSSTSQNLDNGHQLKQLFGHIELVQLDELICPTTATSVDAILSTFNNDIDEFWSDVTCSIKSHKVYITAFGYRNGLTE